MRKKIFALALSLALALGLCPALALAAPAEDAELTAGMLEATAVTNLAKGKTFKYKGSTFKVTKMCKVTDDETTEGEVELVKYGGKAKKLTYSAFGPYSDLWHPERGDYEYGYNVVSIGANAFNTKQGKKIEILDIGSEVKKIGNNAFKNMTSLKELDLGAFFANYNYKSTAYKKIGNNAFKGAGKNKGKSLSVYCGYVTKKNAKSKKVAKYETEVKRQLVKKGLSKASFVDMLID